MDFQLVPKPTACVLFINQTPAVVKGIIKERPAPRLLPRKSKTGDQKLLDIFSFTVTMHRFS
jgi:hypothetical protein